MSAPDVTVAAIRSAVAGEFAELHARLTPLEDNMGKILQALTGNGLGVSKGLIGCVRSLEEQQETQQGRLDCIENRWQKIKWAVIGIALGSGLGGAGLATAILKAVN
jgi:hypothetical protein